MILRIVQFSNDKTCRLLTQPVGVHNLSQHRMAYSVSFLALLNGRLTSGNTFNLRWLLVMGPREREV